MNITLDNRNIPVLLLTGYLGSGKTTLLNRILSNRKGIKFAVIVNDIGEVNIDADLIQKGGIVNQTDDSLVALQNGCICCTLKADLIKQIDDLALTRKFDYIVIEASGICEPAPIAQSICSVPAMRPPYVNGPLPVLDCIVTVVDALRMQSEFACGDALKKEDIGDEDIERLVIEQIEFCNIVLLNKASEVKPAELKRVHDIVKSLNPGVKIIECDYGDVDLELLLNTGMFNFDKVATSAAWISEIEGNGHHDEDEDEDDDHDHDHDDHDDHDHEEHHHHHHDHDDDDDDDDDDEHEHEHEHGHHHHHHHHHDEGEAEEYNIGTFVYFRRDPLNLNKFDHFVATKWPKGIIRAKGLTYFDDEWDKCYLFEQAGVQKSIRDAGLWLATMPEDELRDLAKRDPSVLKDWDPFYGDRMTKIVFIGQNLDKEGIAAMMDMCLSEQ